MKYCKNYCEEKGISTSKLNEAQKTLYYIAENMKMDKSISEEGYEHFQQAIKALEQQDVLFKSGLLKDCETCRAEQQPCYNPDEWCHDCSEYNHDKHCCPRYNKVIRKSVEGIKQPKMGHWIANAPQYDMLNPQYICSECGNAHTRTTPYCEMCGTKMIESQTESENT